MTQRDSEPEAVVSGRCGFHTLKVVVLKNTYKGEEVRSAALLSYHRSATTHEITVCSCWRIPWTRFNHSVSSLFPQ